MALFHITTNDTDLHFTNLQYTKMLLIFSNFSVSALMDSVKTGLVTEFWSLFKDSLK